MYDVLKNCGTETSNTETDIQNKQQDSSSHHTTFTIHPSVSQLTNAPITSILLWYAGTTMLTGVSSTKKNITKLTSKTLQRSNIHYNMTTNWFVVMYIPEGNCKLVVLNSVHKIHHFHKQYPDKWIHCS